MILLSHGIYFKKYNRKNFQVLYETYKMLLDVLSKKKI